MSALDRLAADLARRAGQPPDQEQAHRIAALYAAVRVSHARRHIFAKEAQTNDDDRADRS